jgi:hypothetical protein
MGKDTGTGATPFFDVLIDPGKALGCHRYLPETDQLRLGIGRYTDDGRVSNASVMERGEELVWGWARVNDFPVFQGDPSAGILTLDLNEAVR